MPEWAAWIILTIIFLLIVASIPWWRAKMVVLCFAVGSIISAITSLVLPHFVLPTSFPIVLFLDIIVFLVVSLLLVFYAS